MFKEKILQDSKRLLIFGSLVMGVIACAFFNVKDTHLRTS